MNYNLNLANFTFLEKKNIYFIIFLPISLLMGSMVANINILVISTSEIKISVLVDKKNLKKAVDVLHKEFKLDY